jgi:hypothetical protein
VPKVTIMPFGRSAASEYSLGGFLRDRAQSTSSPATTPKNSAWPNANEHHQTKAGKLLREIQIIAPVYRVQ